MTCPECKGTGKVTLFTSMEECKICGGLGFQRKWAMHSEGGCVLSEESKKELVEKMRKARREIKFITPASPNDTTEWYLTSEGRWIAAKKINEKPKQDHMVYWSKVMDPTDFDYGPSPEQLEAS